MSPRTSCSAPDPDRRWSSSINAAVWKDGGGKATRRRNPGHTSRSIAAIPIRARAATRRNPRVAAKPPAQSAQVAMKRNRLAASSRRTTVRLQAYPSARRAAWHRPAHRVRRRGPSLRGGDEAGDHLHRRGLAGRSGEEPRTSPGSARKLIPSTAVSRWYRLLSPVASISVPGVGVGRGTGKKRAGSGPPPSTFISTANKTELGVLSSIVATPRLFLYGRSVVRNVGKRHARSRSRTRGRPGDGPCSGHRTRRQVAAVTDGLRLSESFSPTGAPADRRPGEPALPRRTRMVAVKSVVTMRNGPSATRPLLPSLVIQLSWFSLDCAIRRCCAWRWC